MRGGQSFKWAANLQAEGKGNCSSRSPWCSTTNASAGSTPFSTSVNTINHTPPFRQSISGLSLANYSMFVTALKHHSLGCLQTSSLILPAFMLVLILLLKSLNTATKVSVSGEALSVLSLQAGRLARKSDPPPWERKPSPTDAEEASGLRALVRVWRLLIWPNALIQDTHANNHECIVILTGCLSSTQKAHMCH